MLRPNLRHNVGKLFNGRNDDALSLGNRVCQIAGMFRPYNGVSDLHKLPNGVSNLFIKNATVSDNDNRVDHRMPISLQTDKLMSQPCNGVGFSAACAVLDKVFLPNAVFSDISQQFFNYIQLMVSREYLFHTFLFRVLVGFLDHLGIVFNDAGELCFGQYVLPEIIGHHAIRVRRISCAIFISLVKWQEPAVFPCELRAEFDAGVINGKMHHTSFERKQQIPWIPVILILLDSIICILFRQLIFQFKSDDRQSIDE